VVDMVGVDVVGVDVGRAPWLQAALGRVAVRVLVLVLTQRRESVLPWVRRSASERRTIGHRRLGFSSFAAACSILTLIVELRGRASWPSFMNELRRGRRVSWRAASLVEGRWDGVDSAGSGPTAAARSPLAEPVFEYFSVPLFRMGLTGERS